MLKFESDIKTKISYRFSEKYSENHAYLILNNYSENPEKIKIVLGLISNLSKIISSEAHKRNAVSHYLEKYQGVPLWVLVNFLTMGNMQYFYQSLIDSLQNAVAKDFAVAYQNEHNSRIQFTPEMLESILKIACFFRNVCAHGERLYNFRLNKPVKTANTSSVLGIPNTELTGRDLFSLLAFLRLVLPKNEHETMLKKFDALFNEYTSEFHSVDFEEIMLEMGFKQDWKNYFI